MMLGTARDGNSRSSLEIGSRRANAVLAAIAILAAFAPSAVWGQGCFLAGAGPVNQGMGGAGIAAPLDASGALNWNPASISGLTSNEMDIGFGLVLPTTSVSSQALGMSGTTDSESGVTPVPAMAVASKDRRYAPDLGLGVLGIAGFSANYPSSALLPASQANPVLTRSRPTGSAWGGSTRGPRSIRSRDDLVCPD